MAVGCHPEQGKCHPELVEGVVEGVVEG